MNVRLGSNFDKFISELLESGIYQSQREILCEGLRLLKEREEERKYRVEHLRKELATGIRQADQGQFVDGEKAFQKLRKRSTERKHKAA